MLLGMLVQDCKIQLLMFVVVLFFITVDSAITVTFLMAEAKGIYRQALQILIRRNRKLKEENVYKCYGLSL